MRLRFSLVVLRGLGVIAIFLTGCASVSVKDVARTERGEAGRPNRIYVAPFTVDAAGIKENPARRAPGHLGVEAQQLLSGYLVSELNRMGVPATAVPGTIAPSPNTWVVSGRITRLAEGNRLLRMAVGLGSGGTKFETQVEVRNKPAGAPFLRFHTSGGSNAMPGGITNPVPFSGVPTALLNSKDGITDDSARTARMIAGTIGGYMAEHGWLAREKIPVVKLARP
jgi:hypothetical protein